MSNITRHTKPNAHQYVDTVVVSAFSSGVDNFPESS